MKKKYLYSIIILILISVIIVALGVGNKFISPLETINALMDGKSNNMYNIIAKFRMPRVLCAIFVGSGLAVAGALFQCALKNPLVSPDIIGVNNGATLGASLLVLFFPQSSTLTTMLITFLFGLGTFIVVYTVNKKRGFNPIWIALTGMAIGYLLDGFNQVLMVNASKQSINLNITLAWIKGSLYGKSYEDFLTLGLGVTILILISIVYARKMDILYLGDDESITLGENPVKLRKILILLGVVINGVVVAIAGSIGFIGVIVPQLAKRIFGGTHLNIIGGSAIIGAIFIVVADALARGINPPLEFPISVFTALIGAPYFFYLIKKEMR